ncbi:putative LuxR family transcriptional regulator [Gordonia hirsuta DSM 44140 = NBRC 16056]|uniref:Putative LuxR family transcriptional regulator n=1 Tax=Gordonia hirsuta DSM 44140 = NBRC 16056 TaxID=1121927 RepID=L7L5F5_9ACTN|nr:LuxR C-terminal-related transcriptional regulator [Gordonia hirsuta]GAC55961.1 putative LuxR family transcriptional regulator [Gordonia hirsuta DSM 44140 = NBRC 16056]
MSEASLAAPVTEALRRIRKASGVSLAFGGLAQGSARLRLQHFVGNTTGALNGLAVEAGHGLGGRVMRVNRPMVVNDYLATPQITHLYDDSIQVEGLRAIAAAPVIVDSQVIAVLYGGLHCDNLIGGRMLDILTTQARSLEQQVAVARALREAGARSSPDVEALRDRMNRAYSGLRLLAQALDDDVLAEEIKRLTDVLLDAPELESVAPVVLTGRERDVLALAALGYSNARIAAELGVVAETVKGYMKTAMGKLDANTRLEAVVLARRAGVLPG